jgi:hypothetical protein
MLYQYAERRILFIIMLRIIVLSVIVLNIIMLSVVMLSVVATFTYLGSGSFKFVTKNCDVINDL